MTERPGLYWNFLRSRTASRSWRRVLVAPLLLALASCGGVGIQPLMPTPVLFSELGVSPLDHVPKEQRWTPRRVYYATTRTREKNLQRIDYTNEEAGATSLGLALIGFGTPQLSWSDLIEYSKAEEREDVVDLAIAGLMEVGSYTPSTDSTLASDDTGALSWLVNDMNASIEASRDRDLLIYVHGAKVNFYNANAFAAQLDHFMGRDMTSMAFSWPSRQNIVAYGGGGDVRRAYRAAPALTSLIEELSERTTARRIHIVCWSAGGRVTTAALKALYERHADSGVDLHDRFRLGTIYYAAADVPAEEFLDALPALDAVSSRVIVTVSSHDGALSMAQKFMGGGTRLGLRNTDLTEEDWAVIRSAKRLEVIDVSRDWEGRGFDITGHRYWFDHPWASTDVVLSVRSDLPPAERGLAPTAVDLLWAIPPDYPKRLRESLTSETLQLRADDF